jgi:long-chain acyl-CoA synthetase
VVFGDSRPWLGAVLIPTAETSELDEPEMRQILQNAVDFVNSEVGVGERVRKFIIQPEICTTENGMLTPTQKVKRGVVLGRHSEAISTLY